MSPAMDERTFKAAYITQFLASYMAARYDEDCQSGHIGEPYDHQPVSDAAFLADKAWAQVKAHADESRSVAFNHLFALP